uniref:Protocadherin alpha 12 n=1 Tax=Microcebus murinus TaxID=30608 RepID=A0A8C5VS99_MICMU
MFIWRGGQRSRRLLLSLLLLAFWEAGSGQLHYSVPEEAKHGTFVGRVAQDLGLELAELVPRLFRVASKDRGDLLEVNLQNGILFVNSRIDREELCGRSAECSIHLEVIVDRPLQVFHVEVEVRDINDNSPEFRAREQKVLISESAPLDSRFPLEGASDADIGVNSLLTYVLSVNEHFVLRIIKKKDKSILPELVLRKLLDREETPEVNLLLMVIDGGKPELTGSVQIQIIILDVNDNAPEFDKPGYKVALFENVQNDTTVIQLNASDPDEGLNREISYGIRMISPVSEKCMFSINPDTGEIRIYGKLDFEENNAYEIQVIAIDKGIPSMAGHSMVLVEVLDLNDNVPEVVITSLSLPVQEDAQVGTVIALISVSDRDSGANGQVTCTLTPHVPFKLVSTFKNYYSLVLDNALDRESKSDYQLVVTACDRGSPSLSTTASVSVEVADVNDNAPAFAQPEYTVFVKENNPPGCHIFTVSARDADAQENARVSYSLVERRVGERALSSYVSVHAESGKVYALQPLDHEELELLRFQVSARDAGVPPLGSNVTPNDNAPALLAPRAGSTFGAVTEVVSADGGRGHVVAKVRAVDGTLATTRGCRMSWSQRREARAARGRAAPAPAGAGEGPRGARADRHGHRAGVAGGGAAGPKPLRGVAGAVGPEAALVDVNVYLIIAICAVSSLLVLTLLLYTALRCSAPPSEGACGLVVSSAVGSWSHSQQRRQRVCSGEGPPKADLMAFSPSLPPSREDCLNPSSEVSR